MCDARDGLLGCGTQRPARASHFQQGVAFVQFVLSEEGKDLLRTAKVNVLGMPVAIGSAVPPEISQFVRTASASAVSR